MKGRNQFLLKMRGSFENVTVTGARDGDVIVKGKIVDATNPNTAAQQGVRNHFRKLVSFGSTLLPFLNLYYKPSRAVRSPFNEFVAQLSYIKEQLQGSESDEDYRLLQVSNGSLYSNPITPANFNQPVFAGGQATITLNWDYDATSAIQAGTDKVMALEWNPATGDWRAFDTGATRADGTVNLLVKAPAEGFNWYAVFRIKEQLQENTGDIERSGIIIQVNPDETVKYKGNGWA
ncbi:MAG: hypothetical protein KDD02_09735 [Phaeodactylibacter sp.]|nr:hypothetical protein [Phaeodactylibacter sp.]MCB9302610.1 hypothetical protein [Lewinellaceae bacterium]